MALLFMWMRTWALLLYTVHTVPGFWLTLANLLEPSLPSIHFITECHELWTINLMFSKRLRSCNNHSVDKGTTTCQLWADQVLSELKMLKNLFHHICRSGNKQFKNSYTYRELCSKIRLQNKHKSETIIPLTERLLVLVHNTGNIFNPLNKWMCVMTAVCK